MNRAHLALLFITLLVSPVRAQPEAILLNPARVFDGVTGEPHAGWVVLVKGEKIAVAGPDFFVPHA